MHDIIFALRVPRGFEFIAASEASHLLPKPRTVTSTGAKNGYIFCTYDNEFHSTSLLAAIITSLHGLPCVQCVMVQLGRCEMKEKWVGDERDHVLRNVADWILYDVDLRWKDGFDVWNQWCRVLGKEWMRDNDTIV